MRGAPLAQQLSLFGQLGSTKVPDRIALTPKAPTTQAIPLAPAVTTMHQILIYADSLTWGIIPNTRERLPFDRRWPGVLENILLRGGLRVRVLEDCLVGRRTVWEDPFKPGRNGREGLAQRVEMHSPLSLVILLLGTNDFQFSHPYNDAWAASQGIAALVAEIRNAPIEPGMPIPPILVVSPPLIRTPKGSIAPKFRGADDRCTDLPKAYEQVAVELGCDYLNAETVTRSSTIDGVHLDADQHVILGTAIADTVRDILKRRDSVHTHP